MLFNSIEFLIFLSIVFCLHWLVLSASSRSQNLFLLITSYLFYGWWDVRFLSLIFASSLFDYYIGDALYSTDNTRRRKSLLWASLIFNLSLLGIFKYFDFFVSSLIFAANNVGITLQGPAIEILLPVGISFYTFQSLSYSIDIYRGETKPTRHLVTFLTFVSFFPQLVAGPIERAKRLLPQLEKRRTFNFPSARRGLQQILSGMFKKVVVADSLAFYVDDIFANYETEPGSVLLLGVIYFSFQIYADFSGYSDIAIGTARLFGIELMDNFRYPYFSKNIQDFWRRWHISLSTWFRDYVYIPLGGNRCSKARHAVHILLTFSISGLWHGANATFLVWGALHGLLYLPHAVRSKTHPTEKEGRNSSIRSLMQMGRTFLVVSLLWVFFRSTSISMAIDYLRRMASISLFAYPDFHLRALLYLLFFVAIEWVQRKKNYLLDIDEIPKPLRWSIYLLCGFLIAAYFPLTQALPFVYFQF